MKRYVLATDYIKLLGFNLTKDWVFFQKEKVFQMSALTLVFILRAYCLLLYSLRSLPTQDEPQLYIYSRNPDLKISYTGNCLAVSINREGKFYRFFGHTLFVLLFQLVYKLENNFYKFLFRSFESHFLFLFNESCQCKE